MSPHAHAVSTPLETEIPDVDYQSALVPADLVATAPHAVRRTVGRHPSTTDRPANGLDQMTDDYQRAWYCRTQAEAAREKWFAGRAREIDYVVGRADSGDPRFCDMSDRELEITGRTRWSQSLEAQKLQNIEQRYGRWAELYLAFAQFELPVKHPDLR
jgi:hypothetical protein